MTEFTRIKSEILASIPFRSKELREGQYIYNQFYKVLKDKGIDISEVNGTEYDCFYNSKRIPEFLNKVEEICSRN